MRRQNQSGIILVSVIFLSILIGIYVTSATILNRGRFSSAQQDSENRLAELAAKSGLEYAQTRLEENPEWRGALNAVTVDTPSLKVVEDNGNVVGLLTSAGGEVSQFRLRFNHQDGTAGGDDLDDPAAGMSFDSPHISVNNLLSPSEAELPLGDGAGGQANSVADYPVPPGTVALVCEGRVSRDFAEATLSDPNPTPNRVRAVRTIEAFYRASSVTGADVPNAVTMAGQSLDVQLFNGNGTNKELVLSDARTNGAPRIRSRGDIRVTDVTNNSPGRVDGKNGELLVPSGNSVAASLGNGVSRGEEDIASGFYQLEWDQVETPTGASGTLNAGIYAIKDDGSVRYFEMNHEDYQTYLKTNPNDEGGRGTPVTLDGSTGVQFIAKGQDYKGSPSDKHRFVLTDDVLVEQTTSGVSDLTIVPAGGAKEDLDPPATGNYRGQTNWNADFGGPALSAQNTAKINHIASYVQTMEGDNTNNGSKLHQFLLEIADTGTIQSGGDQYSWTGSVLNVNGNGYLAFEKFLNGNTSATALINPNPSIVPNATDVVTAFSNVDGLFEYFKEGPSGAPPVNEIAEVPGSTDTTTVNDVEVSFEPAGQEGVRLASEGDIRIAGDLRGTGASIKADGEIRLVGMGFDIDAGTSATEKGPSVSLYATDKIVISTLKPDSGGGHQYSGLEMKGLVYSWSDVELKTGHANESLSAAPQRVLLQGALVAYGGRPGVDKPGEGVGGNILITGDQVDLIFDPAYLLGLANQSGVKVGLEPLSRSFR